MKSATLLLIAAGLLVVGSGSSLMPTSNIDPAHQFSWSENAGWMNWRDAGGGADGVKVRPTFLWGWIWDENIGWINVGSGAGPYANTSGLNFGVNLLFNDDLDGYAWSENKGWLNFGWAAVTAHPDRARYDRAAQRFRGWVWGENIGWVNLDDATHYVGVRCTVDDQCNDYNPCSCDRCVGGSCTNASRLYGDIDCNGALSVFDIFCQLDLISTGGTSTMPGCNFSNADIDPCTGNGVISIFDIFAVLDAIAGIDPCCGRFTPGACCVGSTCNLWLQATCDTNGGLMAPGVATCTPNPCPLPEPPEAAASPDQAAHQVLYSAAPVQIKLVPSTRAVRPGGTVDVHVFATGATDVRGYEIKGVASDLRRGSVSLVPSIQDRPDGLMNGVESLSAVDQAGGRIVVAATDGSASSAGTAYLGTFTVRVSDDAVGTLRVSLATESDQSILALADGSQHDASVTPATLRITAPSEAR